MLLKSGFWPKKVAKNPDFYLVKVREKWKSCQNRGVAQIEGFRNRGSTVLLMRCYKILSDIQGALFFSYNDYYRRTLISKTLDLGNISTTFSFFTYFY